MEHLEAVAKVDRIVARVVVVVGPACRCRKQPPLAFAPYHERRPGTLDRLWLTEGLLQLVILTVVVGDGNGEQHVDHLERLLEAVKTLGQRGQRDAVGIVLGLEPAGTEAEVESAAGDMVERRHHVRRHRRMAVGIRGHHVTDAKTIGDAAERPGQAPRLEAVERVVGEQRVEVVEKPSALVYVDVVGCPPDLGEVFPGRLLLRGLERDLHVRAP